MITDNITLKVQNNVRFQANVPILGGVQDPTNGQVNSNTLYEWDLSTETFVGITTVSLIVATVTNPTFQTYTQTVGAVTSVEQVVDILNSFNVGLFNFSGTTIWITNGINIYDKLGLL
jgi:hypothetical protein